MTLIAKRVFCSFPLRKFNLEIGGQIRLRKSMHQSSTTQVTPSQYIAMKAGQIIEKTNESKYNE